uniref:Uncharacterized protein n=1 Tax=Arundo donax TaxID=35708 RepID=A0A0A9BEP9_ARUDO
MVRATTTSLVEQKFNNISNSALISKINTVNFTLIFHSGHVWIIGIRV